MSSKKKRNILSLDNNLISVLKSYLMRQNWDALDWKTSSTSNPSWTIMCKNEACAYRGTLLIFSLINTVLQPSWLRKPAYPITCLQFNLEEDSTSLHMNLMQTLL